MMPVYVKPPAVSDPAATVYDPGDRPFSVAVAAI
jgi:hypothetical protein